MEEESGCVIVKLMCFRREETVYGEGRRQRQSMVVYLHAVV